jgi:NADH:ubiquinone oxidoreductase subunit 6 (subunit J)
MNLWALLLPLVIGFGAIYLLLPRARGYPVLWGAVTGALALVLAGWLLIEQVGASVEAFLFYVFSGVAIIAGGLLVTQRQPARAALSFALVVLSTCGLFLLRAAPFLMAATIIIYAGAIIVTFLFVLMLAQQSGLSDADHRSREPFLTALAGFILLAALLFVLARTYDTHRLDDLIARANQASEKPTVEEIERTLGNDDKNSFFSAFAEEVEKTRGSRDRDPLKKEIERAKEDWPGLREEKNVTQMQKTLAELASRAVGVRESVGTVAAPGAGSPRSPFATPPPGMTENVAPLGRALFTDYLLAVELAGTLLLVATVGAIAIAGRRTEGLR